jgi:predicted DNA-binding protein
VELETVSFKAPKEFIERVKRYAKQRSRPVSELVRDGLEWRINEGDPLNLRYETVTSGEATYEGNTGNTDISGESVEALHGMLSTLLAEVRQLRKEVRVSEQRSSVTKDVMSSSDTGNTNLASLVGDTPEASVGAQSTFDTAKFMLGPLCQKQHDYHGQGHSLRQRGGKHECVECKNARSRAHKQRQREVKRQAAST